MRVFYDNTELTGTPEELAEFLRLQEINSSDKQEETTTFSPDDFTPLVNEARTVREELAKNPAFNPYPGRVAPQDSDNEEPASKAVSADNDTGVELV